MFFCRHTFPFFLSLYLWASECARGFLLEFLFSRSRFLLRRHRMIPISDWKDFRFASTFLSLVGSSIEVIQNDSISELRARLIMMTTLSPITTLDDLQHTRQILWCMLAICMQIRIVASETLVREVENVSFRIY